MLQPKRTKFRRPQKGRMKGMAQRGNQLAFGSFGIKTLENKCMVDIHVTVEVLSLVRTQQRLTVVHHTVSSVIMGQSSSTLCL